MKYINYLLLLLIAHTCHSIDLPMGMLDRDKLFDDIMGISEDQFKILTGAQKNQKPSIDVAKQIIEQQQKIYSRALSITQGNWAQPTLEQLRLCVHARLSNKKYNPATFGSLNLIIHDFDNPKKTHARALHEQFPGAFFQVASNFNALEERMGNYEYNLSGMNDAPAHGQESVMATMGATMYRRYLLEPINLLSGVSDIFELRLDKNNTPLIKGLKKQESISNKDVDNFSVGVHHNIIVTSGYNDDGKMIIRENDPFNRPKPAYNKWLPDSGNNVIRVNHIFTGAHDINPKNRDDIEINQMQKDIARAIMYATYEATILTAADSGAKKLILMMLRPEVFNNDPDWVVQAIDRMADIIIASGMQVHIVIRHRIPEVQQKFIDDMQRVIDKIENKKIEYAPDVALLHKNIAHFFEMYETWIN